MSLADRPLPDGPRHQLDDLSDRPLTVPLLIRGSFDNGLFVAFCAGALLFGIVGVLAWKDGDGPIGVILVGIGLAAAVPAVFLGLWLRQQREWLEVTVTGFVLSRQGRRRVYSDDQLVSIAQSSWPGSETKVHRRLVLEIAADEPECIDCRYTVTNGEPDPLAGFILRLVNALAAKAERDVLNGATFRGAGWSLDAGGLRRGRVVCPLEAVTWVGFYDRHLCLWRGDEERPFLRLPDDSRNVMPLGTLLQQRVRQRPGYDTPPSGLSMGRLLLERRSWGMSIGLIVGGLGLVGTVYCLLEGMWARWPTNAEQMYCFAVACGCVAVGGLVGAWYASFGWLCFHERGVVWRGLGDERRLLYNQISKVYWIKDRLLIFQPLPGLGLAPIRFRMMTAKFDWGLMTMRDFACRALAEGWADELPRGPVTWTPRLRFLPGGLEYRPIGLLGLVGEPVSVPYDCINHRIEGEEFLLYVREEKRPACRERVDGPNFFVGLVVLSWIYENNKALSLPDAGEHAPRPEAVEDERVIPGPAEGVKQRGPEKDVEP